MQQEPLHIIAFDVPYPPDYGGAYVVFQELIFLHGCGYQIVLHCFDYGRGKAAELEAYCTQVHYYKRRLPRFKHLFQPYIVSSRANPQLLKNISEKPGLIYIHGIHGTAYVGYPLFSGAVLRAHNREERYYRHLAKTEKNVFKRGYFLIESFLLRRWEKKVGKQIPVASLNQLDSTFFEKLHAQSQFIPPVIARPRVLSQPGMGEYLLFHGNLSVSENCEIALFLIGLFPKSKLVIAGKNPPEILLRRAKHHGNIRIVANPNPKEMDDLIKHAQVLFVLSMNRTGIKMKLYESLLKGRFVVCNDAATAGTCTHLTSLVRVANSAEEFQDLAEQLCKTPFTTAHIEERRAGMQDNAGHQLQQFLRK